ncbi:hypothetical protein J7J81_01850 [bacterium]|nr:hypothetical protein [bacterium]
MRKEEFKELSLKETADRVMRSPCKVIGAVFETHAKYIESREGKEGVRKVEEKMADLGYPLKFREMEHFKYYPVGLSDLVIITAKEIFNWKEKDVFEMGNNAPRFSFIVKMLMKTFLSVKKVFDESPKYWRKQFTMGVLENYKIDMKQKYLILHLKHEVTHPLICVFLAGYFLRIGQYVIKSDKITIKETKCMFRGDPYHEYLIRWE